MLDYLKSMGIKRVMGDVTEISDQNGFTIHLDTGT